MYRTYSLDENIRIMFKTVPITTGINTDLLRCMYYNKEDGIKQLIQGSIQEDNGVYITPLFKINAKGNYIIEMEYDIYKDGSTWKRVGISEFSVGTISSSGESGGSGGSNVTIDDWRLRAVV